MSKSVSIRPRTLAMQELETGPLHRFQDWPNQRVPKRAAGVYTVRDGDRLLYVGMSGRAMTRQLRPKAYGRRRGGYLDRRRTRH